MVSRALEPSPYIQTRKEETDEEKKRGELLR